MTQTFAMLVDAYRELNSRKLFWVSLGLSVLVVLAFGALGVSETGFSILWWDFRHRFINTNLLPPEFFYKFLFFSFGIKFWLAWLASILALISTAGIIPDFVSGGSVELSLSKPIGRLRLFLTKYATGLLFATLQVAVFSLAAFILIGVRGKSWEPGLFLAVPIVVCFFSYLYALCALVGLVTRSTIAALLTTLLFWFLLFAVNVTDGLFVQQRERAVLQRESLVGRIERAERGTGAQLEKTERDRLLAAGETPPEADPSAPRPAAELDAANPILAMYRTRLVEAEKDSKTWAYWARVIMIAKTVLPKTAETVQLLERRLISGEEMDRFVRAVDDRPSRIGEDDDVPIDNREVQRRAVAALKTRPIWWVLGTSLAFEALVLGIASWIFCRRDF